MNHEEFTTLSGVTVSQRYYQTTIEPEYVQGNVDKADFCAGWVKRNKSLICKAVSVDIHQLSLDTCMIDCYKADADRSRQELETERNTWRDVDTELSRQKSRVADLESINAELREYIKDKQTSLDSLMADYNELLSIRADSASKDTEIIKLKAMLFDMTVGSK